MAGLGETLQEARRRRGVSLEEAEQATKIRRRQLEALENEDFARLPAPVYTRGLLRNYAQFLGLDTDSLLQHYPEGELQPPLEPYPRVARPPANLSVWLIGAGVVVLLLSLGTFLMQENRQAAPNPALGLIEVTPAAPSPAPAATPTPVPTATPPRAITPQPPTPTPAPLRAPSLAGLTAAEAEARLRQMGLVAAQREDWHPQVAAGRVFGQEPGPDTPLRPGDRVILLVSRGLPGVPVPNVVGKPEQEARRLLAEAGLRASFPNYQDLGPQSGICLGCIASTDPKAGTRVPPGTEVKIAVRAN